MADKERIVLIVDDEEDIKGVVAQALRKKGLDVRLASDGNQAFQIILDEFIDVVISDIRMPHGEGRELLRTIKSLPVDDRPLIFVMSGYEVFSPEEIKKYGITEFISKPFDMKSLADKIEMRLKKKK
jgi:DNA-binding NtrC family response regulator